MISRGIVFTLLLAIAVAAATRPAPAQLRTNITDIPADAVITLRRQGLNIIIVADGQVLVDGQTFDFDIAAIEMRISQEQLRSLIDGFDRIDFFSLKDRYRDETDGCSTDGRVHEVAIMQTTSFMLNGKSKSVTRYPYECLERDGSPYPRDLVALEQQIENMVNLRRR
jgi:hypothetical protein